MFHFCTSWKYQKPSGIENQGLQKWNIGWKWAKRETLTQVFSYEFWRYANGYFYSVFIVDWSYIKITN